MARAQVALHGGLGLGRVGGEYGTGDGEVLVNGVLNARGLLTLGERERNLDHQADLRVLALQQAVARRRDDLVVKLVAERLGLLGLARGELAAPERGQLLVDRAQARRGAAQCGQGGGQCLECEADFEDFAHVVESEAPHEATALGFDGDQSVPCQVVECLADRGPAETRALRQRAFGDRRIGIEPAFDHHLDDAAFGFLTGECGHAAPLQLRRTSSTSRVSASLL